MDFRVNFSDREYCHIEMDRSNLNAKNLSHFGEEEEDKCLKINQFIRYDQRKLPVKLVFSLKKGNPFGRDAKFASSCH